MRNKFMRIVVVLCMALALFTSSACISKTEYGECLGLADQDSRQPDMRYDVSVRNVVLAVIFSEMIFVPLVVVLGEYECPVGPKNKG